MIVVRLGFFSSNSPLDSSSLNLPTKNNVCRNPLGENNNNGGGVVKVVGAMCRSR